MPSKKTKKQKTQAKKKQKQVERKGRAAMAEEEEVVEEEQEEVENLNNQPLNIPQNNIVLKTNTDIVEENIRLANENVRIASINQNIDIILAAKKNLSEAQLLAEHIEKSNTTIIGEATAMADTEQEPLPPKRTKKKKKPRTPPTAFEPPKNNPMNYSGMEGISKAIQTQTQQHAKKKGKTKLRTKTRSSREGGPKKIWHTKFPVSQTTYEEDRENVLETNTCPICLVNIKTICGIHKQEIGQTKTCHSFCFSCRDKLREEKPFGSKVENICPVCRKEVVKYISIEEAKKQGIQIY